MGIPGFFEFGAQRQNIPKNYVRYPHQQKNKQPGIKLSDLRKLESIFTSIPLWGGEENQPIKLWIQPKAEWETITNSDLFPLMGTTISY